MNFRHQSTANTTFSNFFVNAEKIILKKSLEFEEELKTENSTLDSQVELGVSEVVFQQMLIFSSIHFLLWPFLVQALTNNLWTISYGS